MTAVPPDAAAEPQPIPTDLCSAFETPGPLLQPAASPAGPPRSVIGVRLGVAGRVFFLSPDEAKPFHDLFADVHKHYEPIGPIEKSLVDQIAHAIWRLQRVAAMEESIFAMDWDAHIDPKSGSFAEDRVVGPAHTFLTAGKSVDLLSRYEGRLRRGLEKDKSELARLQSYRKDTAGRIMNQAVALHDLAKKENKPYQPEIYFKASPETMEAVFHTETVRLESARREALAAAQARLSFEKTKKSPDLAGK